MLFKKLSESRQQAKILCLDDLVPKNHLLRLVEESIDFSFIYDLVEDLYSVSRGSPSIDPVSLIKIVFIQHLYGIRSMRQTIKEIEVNNVYRWFIEYDLLEPIPHFSKSGKNYVRRFQDTDLFEKIFIQILEEAIRSGFVKTDDSIFIDATHLKASANRKKLVKQEVQVHVKQYHETLMKEINQDRIVYGKKAFDPSTKPKTRITKTSTSDPECGMFYKSEKERCFAYTAHTACDRNNFILLR